MFHAQRQNRVGSQSGTSCVTIEFKLNMDGTIFISETSFHIRLYARCMIKSNTEILFDALLKAVFLDMEQTLRGGA